MPIYEYQCKKCNCVFETLVLGKDNRAPACDNCGSRQVVRKMSFVNTSGGSAKNISGQCSPKPSSGFS